MQTHTNMLVDRTDVRSEESYSMLMRVTLTLSAMATLSLMVSCDSSNPSLDQPQIMERPTTADTVQAPQLNFTKGDQTDDAELLSDLILGEARMTEGDLIQVIPLDLSMGDEILISAWSDQNTALFVYRPGAVSSWWTDETRRALTAEVKAGVDRVELNLSAQETGRYALVLKSLNGDAQNLLTATCLTGPCQAALEALRQDNAREEVEEAASEFTSETPED